LKLKIDFMMTITDTIANLAATRTIEMTTIGHRSGERRTVEIWWLHIKGRFIVTGTPGRRDWYTNVLANPDVLISTSIGTFTATAVTIADAVFRRRVFTEPSANWYSSQEELHRLVETAPMVEIRLNLD
jgi:deazaflavin-dependent oxidoreductase (nitroreductase family)